MKTPKLIDILFYSAALLMMATVITILLDLYVQFYQ